MMSKDKKDKPIDPEQLVDEAIEETFPASDPIAICIDEPGGAC